MRLPRLWARELLALGLLALPVMLSGCHWALNDPGTDPKAAQLYFPSGIAMDPAGQFAYVSNGNADLRYGGGTVMMVDMLRFECAIASFHNQPMPANCPPLPPDMADWDGSKASCQNDPLDPSIVDCDETNFIKQNSTVKIGNFAGAIRVLPFAGDTNRRRLFVGVRGDPSITFIDVVFPGALPDPNPNPNAKLPPFSPPSSVDVPGLLQCVTDPSTLGQRPGYDAAKGITTSPTGCDADHLVQQYNCQGLPTCVLNTNNTNLTQLPSEPFGMEIDSSTQRLLVSHLATGQVSLIGGLLDAKPSILATSPQFFPADPRGRHGAFALAKQHPEDPQSLWYMTSNVNPQIATFRVAQADVVIPAAAFGLSASFAQGGDVRDIAFDVGGDRAFATDNNPPVLMVIDTHAVADNGAGPRNVVTDIVDVCQTPSHIRPFRINVEGAPGTPVHAQTKIVVVCFLSSQIMIVDPDRGVVDDTVISGLGGPNDIAFNFSDETPALIGARHAYVTNYTESTVSVVDLEPGSPTRNRVIARLGFPPDGPNP